MPGKYEVFQDKKGEWRFNLKASNGEIIAVSEGYSSKMACLKGIDSVMENANSEIDVIKETQDVLVDTYNDELEISITESKNGDK